MPVSERALWVDNTAEADDYLQRFIEDDEEMFVRIALWRTDEDPVEDENGMRSAETVASIPGLGARFVKPSPAHAGGYVTPGREDLIELISRINNPSVGSITGDGVECLWLFPTLRRIRGVDALAEIVQKWREAVMQMNTAILGTGWTVDETALDFPFMMRVDGTTNYNCTPAEKVSMVFCRKGVHDLDELLSFTYAASEKPANESMDEPLPLQHQEHVIDAAAEEGGREDRSDALDAFNTICQTDIRRVVMYKGDNPDFDVHIWDSYDESIRVIEFSNKEISKYQTFREKVQPYMPETISRFAQTEWEDVLIHLFKCADRMDMGNEESVRSRFRDYCRRYLKTVKASAAQPKGDEDGLNFMPWAPMNMPQHVVVHAPSMMDWLNSAIPDHRLTMRQVYKGFHGLGAVPYNAPATGGSRYRGWKILRSAIGMR